MFSRLSTRRFWCTNIIVGALFLLITSELLQLTVIRRPVLQELAQKQHHLRIVIPPMRGKILDRYGKEFATSLKVPSVYAIPRLIGRDRREELADKLSKILKMDYPFILERLSRDKAFIWLRRKVSFEQAEKIRDLKDSALGIVDEYRRFYPQGTSLAQILGFADIDNRGIEGVELTLNRELEGRPGLRCTKRDAFGREIKAFEMKLIPAVDGNSVYLTVDQYLQYIVETALDRAYIKWKAKGAAAVLMEAKTGKILAIANRPSFDPNQYEASTADSRRDRAITDMYEPGSIFKIVTASAAINENKVTLDMPFNCENGKYRYGSRILHDVHAYGMLTFSEVIIKSSNIGVTKVAALLKPDLLYRYIKLFGFGAATHVDLPGEAPGFIRAPAQWSKTSPFNIPMGQEVQVTLLQMVTAMGVIANGGHLVTPYIISRIEDQAGVVLKEKKPVIKRQVLRPEVAAQMQNILVRAVEEGTGKSARIDGIAVGGKTGTAQKILSNGKGYSHSNFMSSFVGFGPAEDPQLILAVVVDDPKPLYYGGTVAAPVFKEVIQAALFAIGYVSPEVKQKAFAPKSEVKAIQGNPPMILRPQGGGKGF
ncbi:MAG: penicillin-binding protein 2 [Candidatus Omnitrophica bacterium]|nr:penicillin-binding protein 2 [Candidatus Omnitrophota bacterium]MDD5671768.1 penicillin-binding protein 2 [Candidatus Omnitrophota bacterium]